jgi:FkbM family methyltransferase
VTDFALPVNPRLWLGEGLRWYLTRARHPLKNFVVGRYWSWFAKPTVWIRYDRDATIGVRLGDYLQQRIFFEGYYERPLIEWLKTTLQPDDVFWDVGANIGAVSIVAAGRCRRVVAFEPDPRSLRRLERNIDANRLTNVEIFPVALGSAAASVPLYQSADANTGMTSLLKGRGPVVGETPVRVVRADDVVAERPELAPTVIKLDVEGTEHLVLEGARTLLESAAIRAIVFEDSRDKAGQPSNQRLLDRLQQARYAAAPFAASDPHANDGMYNFLATPMPRA